MIKNPTVYAIIWTVIAVLAAYTSVMYFRRWSADTWLSRTLAILFGALSVASFIRIGDALHWWHFLYGTGM